MKAVPISTTDHTRHSFDWQYDVGSWSATNNPWSFVDASRHPLRYIPEYNKVLSEMNEHGIEYLVVGAYAMATYGIVRETKDIDVWSRPEINNANRLKAYLKKLGVDAESLESANLCDPKLALAIHLDSQTLDQNRSVRLDIVTSMPSVNFERAWTLRQMKKICGVHVPVVSPETLIRVKRASVRPRDIMDVRALEGIE